MNDLDASVVTLVSHGFADALARSGFDAAHIEDTDARAIYRAALDMLHRAVPVQPKKLNLLSATWGELRDAQTVKELLSLNGSGEASPEIVARKCHERYLLRQAQSVRAKFDTLLKTKPNEIRDWLPTLATEMESVATTGEIYNPNPEAHRGSVVRPVIFKSGLKTYNEMFEGRAEDGGGYRKGWWAVWMGITGQGKSAAAYTQACDGIRQGRKVIFVIKENLETVRARVLLGLTGLTLKEIETETAVEHAPIRHDGQLVTVPELGPFHEKSVRQELLRLWTVRIQDDGLLRLYPWTFFKSASIKRILRDEKPDQLHLDYIDQNDVAGNDKVGGLGKIAGQLEAVTHESESHVSGYFQISADEKKKYEKNDNHEITGPFGSSMVIHTADQAFQTKWWRQPYTQHIRRTKCRAGGLHEEWKMAYLRQYWTYGDLP